MISWKVIHEFLNWIASLKAISVHFFTFSSFSYQYSRCEKHFQLTSHNFSSCKHHKFQNITQYYLCWYSYSPCGQTRAANNAQKSLNNFWCALQGCSSKALALLYTIEVSSWLGEFINIFNFKCSSALKMMLQVCLKCHIRENLYVFLGHDTGLIYNLFLMALKLYLMLVLPCNILKLK